MKRVAHQSKNTPPHLGARRSVLEPEHGHRLLSPPASQRSVYSAARWQCAVPSDLQHIQQTPVNNTHDFTTGREQQIIIYGILSLVSDPRPCSFTGICLKKKKASVGIFSTM